MAKTEQEKSKVMESNKNLVTMSIDEAKKTISSLIGSLPASECPSIVLIGAVGVGKTQSLQQIAAEREMSMIVRHLSQVHPLDLGGVGLDSATRTLYFAKPPLHDEVMSKLAPRLLILDEIDRVQPIAQNALLQILSERKQNGYFMEDTYVVAAANAWYAQYTYELDKAMASRLCVIHVQTTPVEWVKWALQNKVHSSVVMTINMNPDVLNQQGSETDGALKVADPRAWHNLSHALYKGFSPHNAAMYVGLFAAEKFNQTGSFLAKYSKEIVQAAQGKKVTMDSDGLLFALYQAAAGTIKDGDQGINFLKAAQAAMGNEKTYIVGALLNYNMGIPREWLYNIKGGPELHAELYEAIKA